MSRHLLVDADVLVYQFAHSCQVATKWDRDLWTWHAKEDEGRAKLANYIDELLHRTKSDEVYMALSCLEHKFRTDFCPTYKGNRAGDKRPMLFAPLREFLLKEYDAVVYPNLEGDDALGIMATDPEVWGADDEVVIATIDKDLLTVPALHFNWTKRGADAWKLVDAETARVNHLFQALAGDAVDGYKGCPGIGPVKASRILQADPTWEAVVRTYEGAGLNADVALMYARCAYILQYGDYDEDTNKVRLWTPPEVTT